MNDSINSSMNENVEEEKIKYYLSPFRGNRSNNPSGWDEKVSFWKNKIMSYFKKANTFVFNAKDLPEKLSLDQREPECLNTVLQQMIKENLVTDLNSFQLSASTWLSWSLNKLVYSPAKWTFNNVIKSSLNWTYERLIKPEEDYVLTLYDLSKQKLPDQLFVFPPLVSEAADEIYKTHLSNSNCLADDVISYNLLKQRSRIICSDDLSFEAAILVLCKRKLANVQVNRDGDKFIVLEKKVMNKSLMAGNEEKVYKLKMMEQKLEEEVVFIEEQIQKYVMEAKEMIKKDKKNMAKSCLRKKQGLQKTLKAKESTLDKIHQLLNSIKETESNKQILDALNSGVEAMKGIHKNSGLDEDKINKTMDEIFEVLDLNEEINQSLNKISSDVTNQSTYEDYENELIDILDEKNEEKNENENKEKENKENNKENINNLEDAIKFPKIPTHLPIEKIQISEQ